jgi:hypothetical protein
MEGCSYASQYWQGSLSSCPRVVSGWQAHTGRKKHVSPALTGEKLIGVSIFIVPPPKLASSSITQLPGPIIELYRAILNSPVNASAQQHGSVFRIKDE